MITGNSNSLFQAIICLPGEPAVRVAFLLPGTSLTACEANDWLTLVCCEWLMIITVKPNIILLLLMECGTRLHKMAGVPKQMGYSSWRLPGPSSISTETSYRCVSTKMRKHQSVRARKQLQYSKDEDICGVHPSYFWANVEIRNSRGGEVRRDAAIISRSHTSVRAAQLLTYSRHYCHTFRLWQFNTLYVHQDILTVSMAHCYTYVPWNNKFYNVYNMGPRGRSRVRFPMVSLDFFHWQSFRPHYGPRVDSASTRNEYQECFLGVKAAGAYGW